MQFLILTRRRTETYSDADFTPLLGDEAQGVRKLFIDGFIRQIWHRNDLAGAALLVEAASEEEARKAFMTLPLVSKGMLEITHLIALKPYAGFGPR